MKFRKKPVVIEAIRWTGKEPFDAPFFLNGCYSTYDNGLCIPTLEGMMTANIGDWIIKGIKGELYPCKNDIFEATYEKVEE